jgi:hypothetical protein
MELVFSKTQIRAIFADFIEAFDNENLQGQLRAVAPDEAKMAGIVEKWQSAIFQKHGIDPQRGFTDLGKVMQVHQRDEEITQLVMSCAAREEQAMNEAIGQRPAPSLPPGSIPPGFNVVQQFQQMLTNPAMVAQQALLTERLQSDPEYRQKMEDQMQKLFLNHPELAEQRTKFQQWLDTQGDGARERMLEQFQQQAQALTQQAQQQQFNLPRELMLKGPSTEDMENEME